MKCVSQLMVLTAIAVMVVPLAGAQDLGAQDLGAQDSVAQAYRVTDLGVLSGTESFGESVNQHGVVAGSATTTDDIFTHAFKWTRKAGITDIGTLGGDNSAGTAISAPGVVAGTSQTTGNVETHAFLYTTGFIDLGTLIGVPSPGAFSIANSINDSGQVAGASDTAAGPVHAFYWDSKKGLVDLGTLPGGTTSEALYINPSGVAVGDGDTASGTTDAAYWDANGVHDIGNLGGGFARGFGGNMKGDIVGGSVNATGESHAFLWDRKNETMMDLGTLGGTFSVANGMRVVDGPRVVGSSTTPGDADSHAFLWTANSGMIDLNTKISATSGWDLQTANSINKPGQITGTGTINGATHAFLLTPID